MTNPNTTQRRMRRLATLLAGTLTVSLLGGGLTQASAAPSDPDAVSDSWQAATVTGELPASRSSGTADIQALAATFAELTPPTLGGTPEVGQTLRVNAGTYDTPVQLTYQWAVNGTPVPDATAATFALTPERLGNLISVEVTATAADQSTLATTLTAAQAVAKGTITVGTAPAMTTGTLRVGATVTVTNTGGYTPAGPSLAYQWMLDSEPIPDAITRSLTIAPEMLGGRLSVTVTASADGYVPVSRTASNSNAVVASNTTPTVVIAPAISGVAQVGSTLTASPGSYSVAGLTYTYQWFHEGAEIEGATAQTYVAGPSDANAGLRVRVTGSSPAYPSVTATSDVVVVAPLTLRVQTPPALSGSPVVGQLLTVSEGRYDATGVTVETQWRRDGDPIADATGPVYRVTAADAGHAISVTVVATKAGHAGVTTYVGPVAVALMSIDVVAAPAIIAPASGPVTAGAVLTVDPGRYTVSAGVSYTYQWTLDGEPIAGATGKSLKLTAGTVGHLVACGVKVTAPGASTLTLRTPALRSLRKATASIKASATKAAYGKSLTVTATVSSGGGRVVFTEGAKTLGTAVLVNGKATLNLPALSVGKHSVTARYAGDSSTIAAVTGAVKITIVKGSVSSVKVTAKKFKARTKPTVTIRLGKLPNGNHASGKVKIYVGSKAVKTVKLSTSAAGKLVVKLPKAYAKTIKVKATYLPTDTARYTSKTSSAIKLAVKR